MGVKNIYFDIAAIFILAVLLFSATYRRSSGNKSSSSFILAVFVIAVATLFDFASISLDNMGLGYVTAKWICHSGYLFFHTVTSLFYLAYIILLIDTWHIVKKKPLLLMVLILPSVVYFIIAVTNPLHHQLFFINENDVYVRGNIFISGYIVGALNLFYGIFWLARYRRLFDKKELKFLFLPYPVIAIAMVIQYFFPDMIVEMFFNALVMVLIWMNIQRPEKLLDPKTELGNYTTYADNSRKVFINHKEVLDIRVVISGFNSIRDMMGPEESSKLLYYAAERIKEANKKASARAYLFYIEDGTFIVRVNAVREQEAMACGKLLENSMHFRYKYRHMDVEIACYICIFRIPEDIPDFNALGTINSIFQKNESFPENTLIQASDVYKDSKFAVLRDINVIMERAFENNSFEVWFQPIYCVKRQRFASAEALLRLKDSVYGYVSPEALIVAAEENGSIYRISEIIFRKVCAFVSSDAFKEAGFDYVEINLSVKQCMQENLTENLLTILKTYNIEPSLINMEITETALVSREDAVEDCIRELKRAGFGISLDDFGSGYSNISRIMHMPLDIVKIDRTLICGEFGGKQQIILNDLMTLFADLSCNVLVEGVETDYMARLLSAMGCNYIQGYYYARPMPTEKLIPFLK